jgi:hypothetical protein
VGGPVLMSELFENGKDTLFLYSFKFIAGEQGLALEAACPSCTSNHQTETADGASFRLRRSSPVAEERSTTSGVASSSGRRQIPSSTRGTSTSCGRSGPCSTGRPPDGARTGSRGSRIADRVAQVVRLGLASSRWTSSGARACAPRSRASTCPTEPLPTEPRPGTVPGRGSRRDVLLTDVS